MPSVQPHIQPNADFIAKLAQGIAAATKNNKSHGHHGHHREQATALTHLTDVITP